MTLETLEYLEMMRQGPTLEEVRWLVDEGESNGKNTF